jgi:DNA-binding MarR family transcriptional regulator
MPREAERRVVDQVGGNITLDLLVLHQHLGSLLDLAFADSGLTASQYAVYSQLARGPQVPGLLLETLGFRPATLSGYLATMTRRGHVDRVRNEVDGRSAVLTLTESGREQWQVGRDRIRTAIRAINAELGGAAEADAVRLVLGRLDSALLSASEKARQRP